MTARSVDTAIARLARTQHGAFNRRQAMAAGATLQMIARRLAAGAWLQLGPGVYALAGNDPTWHRQLKAAQLSIPGAVVSGTAAAALHRLTGFRRGRPEITVPPTGSRRCALAVVRRSPFVEATTRDRIAVTTLASTFVDLAARVSSKRLGRALDDLVVARRFEVAALAERYVAVAHHRPAGAATISELLERRTDGWVPTESELEDKLDEVLVEAGVPGIVRQFRPPWRTAERERVDVAVPTGRVIIEADGRRWHTRVEDFDRDHARNNLAVLMGWRPLRYGWFDLTRRRAEVVDERRALAVELRVLLAKAPDHAA